VPSTAASQIIFFIAALIVSMAIAGTLISTTTKYSNDIEKRGSDMGTTLLTDIKIINDPVAMPYNASNNTITLYIQNTGSTIIPFSNQSVHVMINGTFYSNLTFVLPSGASSWAPQIILTIVVKQVTLPDNDYRLKVVVTGGIYHTITFRIG